jgi:hypothetical protein
MIINTNFDVSQLVWFINNNKIEKGRIMSVNVLVSHKFLQKEIYSILSGTSHEFIERSQSDLFGTKELLIASIE